MNIVTPGKDNPIDSDYDMPLKRTRAKRSCDFCRKRKSRCDADHAIPCSNCRAWGYSCEFVTVRKKRGPPSVYVENLEARCKKMEGLIASLTKRSIKEIEQNDFRIEGLGTKDSHETSFIDRSGFSSMEEAIENLSLEDYDTIKYTGTSAGITFSDNNLLKTKPFVRCPGRQDVAMKLMPQNELLFVQANASSLSGKYTRLDVGFSLTSTIFDSNTKGSTIYDILSPKDESFPTYSMIQKASGLYFTYIHPFLPIVNKSRFEAQDLKQHGILVQAVLAVAFRFASRHFRTLFKKKGIYAETYFKKVMHRLQDTCRARLCHVQAALLMVIYLDMDEGDIESLQWNTLGKAIRMAQDIGLHRSPSGWDLPASEIETRNRVFYVCYILDRMIGARAGKPLTILDRDFDTDLPLAFEVYDDKQSDGNPVYQSFIGLIKLSEILGRILKAIYAPKSKNSNSNAGLDDPTILAVFDRRLKHWKSVTLEPGIMSHAQKVNLLLYYYTIMLLLHRPFIESSSTKHSLIAAESRKACESAAYNIMVVVQQKQALMNESDSYFPLSLPTFFVYSLFQSCLIHLALFLQNRDSVFRLRRLEYAVSLLQQHQEQLVSVRRAHHILVTVMNVHGISLNTVAIQNVCPILLPDPDFSAEIYADKEDDMPKANWCQRRLEPMNRELGLYEKLDSHLQRAICPLPSITHPFASNTCQDFAQIPTMHWDGWGALLDMDEATVNQQSSLH